MSFLRLPFTPVLLISLSSLPAASAASLPTIDSALLTERWPAHWITHPDSDGISYEVLLFRRQLSLTAPPANYRVHLSADNRYRLWVNGTSVTTGPQRDDRTRWRFDTVDLAPHLVAGENVVAVQVWNYGVHRPLALPSVETGLIVQGDGQAESALTSADGSGWRVLRHRGLTPEPIDRKQLDHYIVVGPGDRLNAHLTPWGWQQREFDDAGWLEPRAQRAGTPVDNGVDIIRWLAPRNLPLLEETPQRGLRLRRSNRPEVTDGFLQGHHPLRVPPHTQLQLLLDHGTLTTAFPELRFSGGRDATVTLEYAEALVDDAGEKGHRDEVEGRRVLGVRDVIRADGGDGRSFSPLDYRTYRYIELTVQTEEEPLVLEDLSSRFTAYPFLEHAGFRSDDADLAPLWEIGWRTARLCAYETYIDCPYYEQLQYLGDTRIQALISLYVSGDDRLMRQAIDLFDRSRGHEGLTQSRYPSAQPQIIPPFSLFWIGMVYDYHRLRDDLAFVRQRWRGVQAVLGWFEEQIDPATGLLGPLPFWGFVDWAEEWKWSGAVQRGGEPPGAKRGGSSILTLQYAIALQEAAEVGRTLGEAEQAETYATRANTLVTAVLERCWQAERQLLADTPEHRSFSEHANALAVLSGGVTGPEAAALLRRLEKDPGVVRSTVYFRFYLLRAFKAAGLGDDYLAQLGPWHEMIARGLTTFAEKPDPTRSDCHAWSASPVYELLATVAGIEPASPGFRTVRIAPHPGHLREFEARMPHPQGEIRVKFRREAGTMQADVTLPEGLQGEFHWQGRSAPLRPGRQALEW